MNFDPNFFLCFFLFSIFIFSSLSTCTGKNVKKNVEDNRDDNGDTNDDSRDDSLDIPLETEPNNITCTRRQNSMIHEIRSAKIHQFPFMAAVMSRQNEYLCSGAVVSNGLVLTTAQCTLGPISYLLLNTTNDKKDDTTAVLHITKSERFPTFTGSESLKDVGLIYTTKHNNTIAAKIKISNYTKLRDVVDFEAIGFGLNANVGQTRHLQYVGLESRSSYEIADVINGYLDCVDTKVTSCFKDTGGPIISDNELLGVIIKGQNECSKELSSVYAVNKNMVEVLPAYIFRAWLDERIKKHEALQQVALTNYPQKPNRRYNPQEHYKVMSVSTSEGNRLVTPIYIFVSCLHLFLF